MTMSKQVRLDQFQQQRTMSSLSTTSSSVPTVAASSTSATSYGASCSSFYTSEEKKDSYETLEDVLRARCRDARVRRVVRDLVDAVAAITEALRTALVTVEGSANDFGDAQLSVDMIADRLLWDAVRRSPVIREGASEEDPVVRDVADAHHHDDAEFTVCWDPLDGSSIVDNNWAVGTMVGVWPRKTGLIGATGRDQVTSLVAMYGPRTTVLVALDDGVYEFSYGCSTANSGGSSSDGSVNSDEREQRDHGRSHDAQEENKNTDDKDNLWICSRSQIQISPDCKIFSPANLRAAQESSEYRALVDYYMTNRYTLRYTGGLVPDVYQQFTKRQGVFCNPTSTRSPAKLRLAFEAAPFALLVEKAGGLSSDAVTGASILDVTIHAVDQRTALCLGSAHEVTRFNETMGLLGGGDDAVGSQQ